MQLAVFLVCAVIFVNGFTDAPNAIAAAVACGALKIKKAVALAAVFNLLGALIMTSINSGVALTVFSIADFGAFDSSVKLSALAYSFLSIVIWAVLAWYFGIPTSEGHALAASLTGASAALCGNFNGINFSEWIKIIYGMVISLILGYFFGYICSVIVKNMSFLKISESNLKMKNAQIIGASAMAFMHGAQDGQKFMGVILLSMFLVNGQSVGEAVQMPVWIMILCSVVMGVGTSVGGKKIIKSVGMDMVKLEKYQGFSADIAASLCLLFSSTFGIPVSTTHAKTTAIMGVGAVRRLSAINFSVVKDMGLTWILTFPGCGLIGFLMTKLFMMIF